MSHERQVADYDLDSKRVCYDILSLGWDLVNFYSL